MKIKISIIRKKRCYRCGGKLKKLHKNWLIPKNICEKCILDYVIREYVRKSDMPIHIDIKKPKKK